MSSNQFFGSDFSNNPFVSAQPAIAAKPVVIEGVEIESKSALEIEVRWGDQILHVMHLSPARDVFVGDDAEGPVDYKLPIARTQIARANGESVVALTEAGDVTLARGEKNERRIGDFTIRAAVVAAGKAPPRDSSKARRKVMGFWAASAALHLALIGGFMFAPGASLDDESAGLDKSTQAYLMQMQSARADREIKQEESDGEKSDTTNGSAGGAHAGASGQMGKPDKSMTGGHYQVKGPPESSEEKLAKTHALIESNRYGAIGALASVFGSTSNAPISFNGGDESIGKDPADYQGNLFGDHPGDSFGYNGLGPSGTGPGGGGWLDGVGLNRIGGFGHACVGSNCGPGGEWGGGPGGKGLKRTAQTVKMIDTGSDSAGKLPPETIKRVIRANFPRFRQCYEGGLKKDPGLKGTVAVRFIIDTTGAIESASLSGGSMSDSQVSSCVLGVYKTLSFPEPESGKVMVNYPIDFQNE
jgi:hypothetical protein